VDALGDELRDDAPIEVPISAIEHFSYCPRQCALIHVEQTFEENLFTVRGHLAHERVDAAGEVNNLDGVQTVRGAPLWSERHGLRGKADAIEFHQGTPYPVEYKVGRRHGPHADLQVCAQALCLEEMLGVSVPRGALYYHSTRHRHQIAFDASLRQQTTEIIAAIRDILSRQIVPPAVNDARCPDCSLLHACLPSVVGERARIRGLQGAMFRIDDSEAGLDHTNDTRHPDW
jgi:CRISPR-associated exonuclease Cas4